MPSAPIMLLTAPLMLAPAPVPQDDALVAAIAPTPIIAADSAQSTTLLPITWSLVQVETSQDAAPPSEEGEASDEDENEIVVEGEYGPVEADPMGAFNEESFRITQQLDEVFLEPIAYAYRDGLPTPLRDGLGNVVRNLSEPINFLNYLLQFKFGKAIETLGRFAINSSLGLGGLFDIAGEPGIGLPYRRNGFANTMGFYGIGSGAYLYLPVTGATSVRDIIGNGLDQFVLPVAFGDPFNTLEFTIPYFMISSLDARLEVDAELERIGAMVDPYAARRDSYLYRREREIAELRGEEPPPPPAILDEVEGTGEFSEDFEEDFEEEGAAVERLDGPQIAYEDTLETPAKRPNLVITHVRVARSSVAGEAPRTR